GQAEPCQLALRLDIAISGIPRCVGCGQGTTRLLEAKCRDLYLALGHPNSGPGGGRRVLPLLLALLSCDPRGRQFVLGLLQVKLGSLLFERPGDLNIAPSGTE